MRRNARSTSVDQVASKHTAGERADLPTVQARYHPVDRPVDDERRVPARCIPRQQRSGPSGHCTTPLRSLIPSAPLRGAYPPTFADSIFPSVPVDGVHRVYTVQTPLNHTRRQVVSE